MGTQNSSTGQYRTADLYYAAYLKVAGVPYRDSVRENGRVYFLFNEDESSQAMRDLRQQFFNGRGKVSALEYKQAIQTFKTITHMD